VIDPRAAARQGAAGRLPAALVPGQEPLVSCVMPTYNRRAFVPQAITYFLRQDYPNRELVVLDDGTDRVADLMPPDPRVRYIAVAEQQVLGTKRNRCCAEARGDIIVHWDDDDWQADWRLSYQVAALLAQQVDICGLANPLYYDPARHEAWQYIYPARNVPWVAGGTLCFTRSFWARNPFNTTAGAATNHFQWSDQPKTIAALPDPTFYICLIHPANISPKQTHHSNWYPYPLAPLQAMMGADWALYQ
jgi:glycosyltransferase involved in cell wall biosynthesis